MKTNRGLRHGAVALLLVAAIACASAQTNAYRVIATAAQTVDTAHNVYNDFVAAGKVSPAMKAKVADAYHKYQTAMLLAQAAYQTWKGAGFPGGQESQVLGAAANAAAAANDFARVVASE